VVAERLRGCLQPADLAARLGGDEFAVLVPEVADEAEAVALGERLAAILRIADLLDLQVIADGIEDEAQAQELERASAAASARASTSPAPWTSSPSRPCCSPSRAAAPARPPGQDPHLDAGGVTGCFGGKLGACWHRSPASACRRRRA
jgi:predicted signal transduction protein with EAL and GGDEF domain